MKENELNYGNFAEPKGEKVSKRSEDVLLTALDKIEQLEEQIKDEDKKVLEFDEIVGKLNQEHIKKLDEIDIHLRSPRFVQTDSTTPTHEIRVITYIMTRRKK
jgi:hypothetical protein